MQPSNDLGIFGIDVREDRENGDMLAESYFLVTSKEELQYLTKQLFALHKDLNEKFHPERRKTKIEIEGDASRAFGE